MPVARPGIYRRVNVRRASTSPRRGLRRPEAAAYVGVSVGTFDEWVRAGTMPEPIRIGVNERGRAGIVLWDILALDEAFDRLSDPATVDADDDGGWR